MRTEPFEIHGVAYRIIWDHKIVQPVPLENLTEWCRNSGCKRIARLREVHAASLQQAWVARMGRVGIPVAPPYFSPADFRMYVKTGDSLVAVSDRIVGGVVLTQTWRDSKIVHAFTLTQDAVIALTPGFKIAAEEFSKAAALVPPGDYQAVKVAPLNASANAAAKAAVLDLTDLFQLMEGEHILVHTPGSLWSPQSGAQIPITCIWDGNPGGKKWKDLGIPNKSLLILDILPPEVTVKAAHFGEPMEDQGGPTPVTSARDDFVTLLKARVAEQSDKSSS